MLRKRLIFALIHSSGNFMQSRNFRLQRVGDINWLERNYRFQEISFSLDELIVLDATKLKKNIEDFVSVVRRLVGDVFIPVAAGGGIRSLDDADKLFMNGADKVVLNTVLFKDESVVNQIVRKYGSQSVIACIDYKNINGRPVVHISDGTEPVDQNLENVLLNIQNLGVGEILLNSIEQDGTGFGYDMKTTEYYSERIDTPLIVMGGAGNASHLEQGLLNPKVSAVATANLFNFIGDGLPKARETLLRNGANLANWSLD